MGRARTYEEIEQMVNDLGYILLDEYIPKKGSRRVVIRDEIGYEYDCVISDLINGHIPDFVAIANPNTLKNISLWLKLNRRDFELADNNVYCGANEKLTFYHNIQNCKEYFNVSWHHIYSGQGCSVCHGKQIGERTSFAYLYPNLMKDWHPCNTIDPNKITKGYDKKVYWICSVCGYGENKEWFVSPNSRTNMNSGCKNCYDLRKESLLASELKMYFLNRYNAKKEYCIFKNPKTHKYLPFDIYIPTGNNPDISGIYVEVHGLQHYRISSWDYLLSKRNNTTPQQEFDRRKHLDKIKKNFAKKNGIYVCIDLRKIKYVEDAINYIEDKFK